MAEPPASTPSQVGALGWDGLLSTKLHVPRLQPGFVPRPHLVERLEQALAERLVLVSAPAGFGKTALLADWARQRRQPVAWLSLDPGDNDPARFWRYATAALDRARPGIAEHLAPLLGLSARPSPEALAAVLINQLAAEPDQVLMVLDDYHLIDAEPVHASLEFLLEHLPPGVRLVLASRADPPLPLARLRARGHLAEIRAADLRFTAEEAATLLRAAGEPDLPDGAVAALTARTEGWVAGLQLAGLSLRGQPDVAAFVASFSGSHRFVLDFLSEEVLERQPDQVRTFLLETSVLDRLSGELCDAVTGRPDGQAMLERIERSNLFLVPLDGVRGWWRYHHLFADLLRARLQQRRPERVPELHRNAAAWHERHGMADEAVRHALAAGETAWAARLVERHVDGLVLRSERVTLAGWLAALPAELVAARPRLLLAQTLFALVSGQVEEVEGPLDAAERAVADAGDEPYQPSVGHAASLVANLPAAIALGRAFQAELRGDADREIAFGRRALAEAGAGETTLGAITRAHLGVAEWLSGRLPEAERVLAASAAELRAAGQRFLATRVCEHLAQVQRAQGRLDAALASYQQALEIAAPLGRPALPAAGIAHVGMAELAYEQGDLEAALRHLAQGIAPCRQLVYTQPLATGLATLGWIRQVGGDPAGAMDAMDEALRTAPSQSVASLLNPVPARRARLLLAQGDLATAGRWTSQRGLRPDDRPDYPREPEYLLLARVLVAQDRPDRALELLERLQAGAAAQGRTGSVIQIRALRALALAACGEDGAAMTVLAQALTLAAPQGWIRVLADEGPPMRALLGRLVTAKRTEQAIARDLPLGYLGRLLRAFQREDAAPAVPGLIEPLSRREVEVLRLLAAGRQNQEIAEELVVAPNTVKKHVTHILDKLGAANRTEATARARELGLLP
jgi:LuxR family transcriptional regulator, maltose regulon positive regulatory protein